MLGDRLKKIGTNEGGRAKGDIQDIRPDSGGRIWGQACYKEGCAVR
jgi:hypothetical protein